MKTLEKEQTHYIHEGEHVILHMLLAVEAHDRVVHSQQHLDVVVVFLGVPPLALGLGQFVFDEVQSGGEAGDPEVCHCKKYEQHVNKLWTVGMGCFFLIISKRYRIQYVDFKLSHDEACGSINRRGKSTFLKVVCCQQEVRDEAAFCQWKIKLLLLLNQS